MANLILSNLSKAMNIWLGLDPESEQRLKKLNEKVITIELLPFHYTFQCEFTQKGVVLHQDALLPAETQIRGTPLQLMTVAIIKDNRQRFFAEDVMMEGNAEIGHEVIALFDELQIDWEEYLSHLIGDINAYRSGRLLKKAKSWLDNTFQSLTDNINEFVHEEAEWLPGREALEDLFSDIDSLRMDVDRINAKIQRLIEQSANDKESEESK